MCKKECILRCEVATLTVENIITDAHTQTVCPLPSTPAGRKLKRDLAINPNTTVANLMWIVSKKENGRVPEGSEISKDVCACVCL